MSCYIVASSITHVIVRWAGPELGPNKPYGLVYKIVVVILQLFIIYFKFKSARAAKLGMITEWLDI